MDELTIGRFARLCRLSVKQLRHYDELGLLPPARVDAFTGYRYYTRAQARDALTIALLREADVPLPGIRAILDAPDPTVALTAERDRLAARIERDRERLAVLTRLASGAAYEITLVDEPALTLAHESATTTVDELGATIGRLIGALLGRTHAWRPPMWGLFPLDIADGMTVTAAAAVPGTGGAGAEGESGFGAWVTPEEGPGNTPGETPEGESASGLYTAQVEGEPVSGTQAARVEGKSASGARASLAEADSPSGLPRAAIPEPGPLILPATRAAATLHHGPYTQLSLAYYALLSWIHDNGLRPVGPARESYLVAPGEAAPEDLITRVVIPVVPVHPAGGADPTEGSEPAKDSGPAEKPGAARDPGSP